ncbi:MAG: YggS family pyridoxal phosphate-dependent enzyme [Candidatus Lindowbacteria bacterium]|nr:YggS family pyridoxal phosphate-dependent enzyme [Candidatus Lindowbacteria bacterium]
MTKFSELYKRIDSVRGRIEDAAKSAGRNPEDITLVGVAKGHNVETVKAAVEYGLNNIGENYLNEFGVKALTIKADWHFQGAVQRRKIKDILRLTRSILSVARLEEFEEINKRMDMIKGLQEETAKCFICVNLGQEESKTGALPDDVAGIVAAARDMTRLEVRGLMAIPPHSYRAEDSRAWFRKLKELAETNDLHELSMGMTNDFEIAIEEGATMVRVGTAIFGAR